MMITAMEWSGWWDQVRMRQGWSAKIGKWRWVGLQSAVSSAIAAPVAWIILSVWTSQSAPMGQALAGVVIAACLFALVNAGRWDADRRSP